MSEERALGDKIAKQFYASPDAIEDPVLQEYVQAVFERLLSAARVTGDLPAELDEKMAWKIFLVRNSTINAFALPGGYFGVHLGLLTKIGSPDELAAVLAHELSHLTQRHISRLIARDEAQAPWVTGAMVLGVLAASKNPTAANAVIAGGQALAASSHLSFSRNMEREADRVGFGVLTQASYEAQGFVTLFEKLQETSKFSLEGPSAYLRSHPLTTERIADMRSRQLSGAGAPASGAPTAKRGLARIEQALIAARAGVLGGPGVDALHSFIAKSKIVEKGDVARRAGALYAAALASKQLRDFDQARALYQALVKELPNEYRLQRLARLLGQEIELASGDVAAAGRLADASDRSRPQLLLTSALAVQAGTPTTASTALTEWLNAHPKDALAWQAQGVALDADGRKLASIRAMSEAFAARLDYEKALDALKSWQALVRVGAVAHHTEVDAVDARIKELTGLL